MNPITPSNNNNKNCSKMNSKMILTTKMTLKLNVTTNKMFSISSMINRMDNNNMNKSKKSSLEFITRKNSKTL